MLKKTFRRNRCWSFHASYREREAKQNYGVLSAVAGDASKVRYNNNKTMWKRSFFFY